MNGNTDETRMRVEVSSKGVVIHIDGLVLSDTDAFDKAYKKARVLLSRIPYLDEKIRSEVLIEQAKARTQHLWISEGERTVLGEMPEKPEYRIALVLLTAYPECKMEADIVRETRIPQRTVNHHLRGDRKSTKKFFTTSETGYSLSSDGISWLIEAVLPELKLETRQE